MTPKVLTIRFGAGKRLKGSGAYAGGYEIEAEDNTPEMRMLAAALDGEVLVCMTEADYRALTGEGQVKPVDEILVRHAIDRMREVADELEGELPKCGSGPECGTINLVHRGPTPEPVCLGVFSGPGPVAMDAGEPDAGIRNDEAEEAGE
jgi:hypothetical protein